MDVLTCASSIANDARPLEGGRTPGRCARAIRSTRIIATHVWYSIHFLLIALWIASELVLGVRTRSRGGESRDRGSLRLLWVAMPLAIGLGIAASFVEGTDLPGSARAWYVGGCVAIACGLSLRWVSVLVLGRMFTVDVAIREGHELVTRGPYRVLRHPSYTGLLVILGGVGAVFGSWLSLACILGLGLPALVWRIAIEERALAERFGERWREHVRRTWRLVPFVH